MRKVVMVLLLAFTVFLSLPGQAFMEQEVPVINKDFND